jgi:UDP-glucose 4-epimerase
MILLTGATGYIGSHTWVELLQAGYDVLGIDNLSNSNRNVLDRIQTIVGKQPHFLEVDVREKSHVQRIFQEQDIHAVLHFAGLKSVNESVQHPLLYYDTNVRGLIHTLQAVQDSKCKHFIFSSSATVYHPDNAIPYLETMPLGSASPYGRTKRMCEQILEDYQAARTDTSIALLRYFNPVGAHPSGLIGENPLGTPNNLMPFITSVAVKRNDHLKIFGKDWNTPDGTCLRDYIHVVDLAKGHVQALKYLEKNNASITVNLGTGKGVSVLEMVHTFEKVTGQTIPYQFAPRRDGDIAAYYANADLAKERLQWEAQLDLEAMCLDSWNWQSKNPTGY